LTFLVITIILEVSSVYLAYLLGIGLKSFSRKELYLIMTLFIYLSHIYLTNEYTNIKKIYLV